jgi:phosphatidate cytidylyltransferase
MNFNNVYLTDLTPPVAIAIVGIFGVLLLSSLIVASLRRLNPGKDYTELNQRLNSWWVMVGLFILALVLKPHISLVFFGMLSFLALKEFFTIIPTRRADRRVLFWAYLAIPMQYYWVGCAWYGMFIIFIPVYMFLFLPLRMILIGETTGFLKALGTLHWGLMMTVFSLSHLAFLLVLPAAQNPLGGGPGLVLFLMFLTQFNDVMQYVWGKLIGRRKIIAKVSPKKTWGGFLGGVATTTLLGGLLGPLVTPLVGWETWLAGFIVGASGFVGDVTISALKRDLGIKDSGSLIPGHGGILDRVDSLTYTAPLFFHYLYYLHY